MLASLFQSLCDLSGQLQPADACKAWAQHNLHLLSGADERVLTTYKSLPAWNAFI